MALSHDEQRRLAEIERRLAAADPGLAARMASFGRTPLVRLPPRHRRRPTALRVVPRSTGMRVAGSVLVLALVGVVSLLVYLLVPFRSGGGRLLGGRVPASTGPPATVSTGRRPRVASPGAAVATTAGNRRNPLVVSSVAGSTRTVTRSPAGTGAATVSPSLRGP